MEMIEKMKHQCYAESTDKGHYTMLISDVFSIYGECIVTGVIDGGALSKRDKVWILGPHESVNTAEIQEIQEIQETEDTQTKVVVIQRGTPGMKVGIWLQKINVDEVKSGFVLASVCPNVENLELPIENPFFKGLMRGKEETVLDRLENYFEQEIKNHAKFLVITSIDQSKDGEILSFPYLTSKEDVAFQPVFTDWTEFSAWYEQEEECVRAVIMSLQEVYNIVKNNREIRGIVINPFSDNVCLNKEILTKWMWGK